MRNDRLLRINTAEGCLRGNVEEGVFVFKGIPYAAPPVGPLRWIAPKPVPPWEGEKDASAWGFASWQSREYCLAVGGGTLAHLAKIAYTSTSGRPMSSPLHRCR